MDHCDNAYEKFKELEKKKRNIDLDDFEDFMRKVEEVNKMIHDLASSDKAQVEKAKKTADAWLGYQKSERSVHEETAEETINDPSRKLKQKNLSKIINFTSGNQEPKPSDIGNLNGETMSQEGFMKYVEEDAKRRSEDRKRRIAESDAIKLKANKSFRDKDFEKALDLYNKAIDIRKDSCVLYTNRALTLLNLELYSRALTDCDTALKLDEDSFKAKLYRWHAYYGMGEDGEAEMSMRELKSKFPGYRTEIEDYENKIVAKNEEVNP